MRQEKNIDTIEIMPSTKEARIEISTLCNYGCIFCPHKTTFWRKKTVMDNELFIYIIDKLQQELPQIDTITLTGMGEVLTDPSAIEKIRACKTRGFKVNILTNGSLLDEKIIDEILALGVDTIRISLHTLDHVQYEKITGSKKHSQVLKMIQYIIDHKHNTKLIISCDIIDINKSNVDELIRIYKNTADILEIWKPHNWSNWGNYRNGERKKQSCGRPRHGPIQIQIDGTINMCCFDYNGKLEIGDLKTQTIKEIFSSERFKTIEAFHKWEENNHLLCNTCDQLYSDDTSIIIYNSKFDAKERISKTSTNYETLT